MTTNDFKVTYKDGSQAILTSDAETAEAQINATFGLSPDEADAFGVAVELIGPHDPDADPADLLKAPEDVKAKKAKAK